jgi:hypothetical protein
MNSQKVKIEYNTLPEEEKKKNQRIKLTPSGSNFDKIILEIGVVIQNDNDDENEIKKGGFEFYHKFNKPSINEYTQLVKEALKLNNKFKYSSLTIGDVNLNYNKKSINNNFNTEQSDYNGYKQVFIDNNNPLIQNSLESFSSMKSKADYNNSNNRKSLIKNKSEIEAKNDIYKGYYNSFEYRYNKKRNNKSKLLMQLK